MKKLYDFGKRGISLLLAVIMVIGLMPISITAADELTAEVTLLEATLTVTEVPGADGAQPASYTYEVKTRSVDADGNETDLQDEVNVKTAYNGISITGGEVITVPASAQMTFTVEYNGMSITLDGETAKSNGNTASGFVKVTYQTTYALTAGQAFNVGDYEPKVERSDNASCEYASVFTYDETQSVINADSKVVADKVVTDATQIGTYTLSAGTNTLAAIPLMVTVDAPVLNVAGITVGGAAVDPAKWYGADVTDVTATVRVNSETALAEGVIPSNLPGVTAEGAEVDENWTRVNATTFTRTVTMTETTTIKVGEEETMVQVDTGDVVVTPDSVSANLTGENTNVYFNYAVGASGLNKDNVVVKSGEAAYTAKWVKDQSGESRAEVTVEGMDLTNLPVSVILYNNAGEASAASDQVAPTGNLAVELKDEPAYEEVNGKTFLENGGKFVFEVSNVIGKLSAEAECDNAAAIASCEVTQEEGASTATVTVTLKEIADGETMTFTGLKLTVKDSHEENRTNTYIVENTAYVVDLVAPEISITELEDGYYSADTKTYTVTVTDDGISGAEEENLILKYTYRTHGEAEDTTVIKNYEDWSHNGSVHTFDIEVSAGQTLTNVYVNATDCSGNSNNMTDLCNIVVDNTEPTMTVEMSDNVKYFYTDDSGRVFAMLDPEKIEQAAEDGDAVTVEMTVTVSDYHLTADCFANDTKNEWTAVEGERISTFTTTISVPVAKHQSAELEYKFDVQDLAHNHVTQDQTIKVAENANGDWNPTHTLRYTAETGFSGSFLIDHRSPSSTSGEALPQISLSIAKNSSENVGDKNNWVFTGNALFDLFVTDASDNGKDSGVKSVSWTVDDNIEGDFLSTNTSGDVSDNGEYEIQVNLNDTYETNNAEVVITVTDYVGNTYVFTKSFVVDNLAPRVEVKYTDTDEDVKNGHYYDEPRKVLVEFKDLNLVEANNHVAITRNGESDDSGWRYGNQSDTYKFYTYDFKEDGEYKLAVSCVDAYGNTTETVICEESDNPWHFVLDQTAPVVAVVKEQTPVQSLNGVDYYDEAVTYTVKFEDAFFAHVEGNECAAELTYVLEADGVENEAVTQEISETDGASITVTDGQVLKSMSVCVIDDAGNSAYQVVDLAGNIDENFGFEDPAEENTPPTVLVYSGNPVAVDCTDPAVLVQKAVEDGCVYIQSEAGKDYYNGEVTYKITVTDRFLSMPSDTVMILADYIKPDGTEKSVPVTLNKVEPETESGEAEGQAEDAETSEFLTELDVYEGFITVEEDIDLDSITIVAVDDALHAAEEIQVTDPDKLTMFNYIAYMDMDGQPFHSYVGGVVVVDKTAPVVEMTVSEEIKDFYTQEVNGQNRIFAVLDPELIDQTADPADKDITVTLTAVVKDSNLSASCFAETQNWVEQEMDGDMKVWKLEIPVTIQRHQTGLLSYSIDVADLAAWEDTDGVEVKLTAQTPADQMIPVLNLVHNKDNGYTGAMHIDRRTPNSNDQDSLGEPPEITISASVEPETTLADERALFSRNFSYNLYVHDLSKDGYDAGIESIQWAIDDGMDGNFLDASGELTLNGENTYSIPVTAAGSNETNSAVLTLVVTDSVGNQYSYKRLFAFDNLAPRVKVDYDNNSAQNGKYFKANRTATISVTELNFNPAGTVITTQVTPSGWTQQDNTWTTTCTYSVDGEYTFAVKSTDLANNTTEDAQVDYEGEVAPRAFVIDKTRPVITVSYDPNAPVGEDGEGVQYYNEKVGVTVSIREVNFSSADVRAEFNTDNSLSAFASNGTVHTARETFDEGNEYRFSVAYTDLAGNAAATYTSETFSVDLTAPTVEITQGDMDQKGLNIVQDELVLGLTINDAQSNLKSYSVKVVRLGNDFKTTEVSGDDYYTVFEGDGRTTITIDFEDIASEKDNDGIYTVEIHATDYAGHTVALNPELLFSLNRFGSTFTTDDPFTQQFLLPSDDGVVYKSTVDKNLVIKEINPNRVYQDSSKQTEGSVLTVVVNGSTTQLVEGQDYTVEMTQEGTGSAKWYVYTYTIDAGIFTDGSATVDGRYSLLIYGEDEAGNKNTNESNAFGGVQMDAEGNYSGKMTFTLDAKAPVISTTGIESGKNYNAENQKMNIYLSDNTPVSIAVMLNGQQVQLGKGEGAANAAWLVWDAASGSYVLNVPQENSIFGGQNVEITVTDAAGNVASAAVEDFTVSTNMFVRLVNSIWFYVLLGIILILLLIFILKKGKKKETAAA